MDVFIKSLGISADDLSDGGTMTLNMSFWHVPSSYKGKAFCYFAFFALMTASAALI